MQIYSQLIGCFYFNSLWKSMAGPCTVSERSIQERVSFYQALVAKRGNIKQTVHFWPPIAGTLVAAHLV